MKKHLLFIFIFSAIIPCLNAMMEVDSSDESIESRLDRLNANGHLGHIRNGLFSLGEEDYKLSSKDFRLFMIFLHYGIGRADEMRMKNLLNRFRGLGIKRSKGSKGKKTGLRGGKRRVSCLVRFLVKMNIS